MRAARTTIVHIDFGQHRNTVTHRVFYGTEHPRRKAHPILGAAAKLVSTAVVHRRDKLIEQISVTHVDLDRIEARLNAELGTLDKARDHLVHVTLVHGASKHVAAQQARGVEATAGALEGGRHEGTRDE